MSHVFICYSRKDQEQANAFKKALENCGKDVWIDLEDLPASSIWRDEIRNAITGSIALIYLLSSNSVNSQYCQKELEHALQLNKKIFPVLLPSFIDKDVPDNISNYQWLYWSDFGGDLSNLQKLTRDIDTNYPWLRYHTDLEVKATRWEENKDRSRLLRGKELREAEEQLAMAGQKDPQPTDLQRQYVLESRKGENRNRNSILTAAGIAIIALSFLSIFAFNQRNLANDNASTAVANQHIAQTAQAKAEEQTRIALARQLASQAQIINEAQDNRQMVGVLLAAESMKLDPSIGAFEVLQNNLQAHSILKVNGFDFAVFSPDSKKVLVSDQNGATIYDTQTGKKLAVGPYSSPIGSGTFSSDSKWVLSTGSQDFTLRIWDASTGKEIKHYAKHSQWVAFVSVAPDNEHALSCSQQEAVCIVWKVSTGEELLRVSNVYAGYLTPDGMNLVYFTEDTLIHVTNIATGNEISQIKNEMNATSVIFTQDSKFMLTSRKNFPNTDYPYTLWEITTGKKILEKTKVVFATFSLDGKRVLLINKGGECQVYDTYTGKIVDDVKNAYSATFLQDGSLKVSSISGYFLPDGKHILTIPSSLVRNASNTLAIKDAESGVDTARMSHDDIYNPSWVMSPDGTKVFSYISGVGILWETKDVQHETAILKDDNNTPIGAVMYSPDGKLLLTEGGSSIGIWDTTTNKEISHMIVDSNRINDVTFSPDGKLVASASDDKTTRVWDAMTGKEISEVKFEMIARTVAFSPDSKWVASGGDSNTRIWETSSGREIARIDGVADHVAFNPTGDLVAAASTNQITIWDVNANKQVSIINNDSNLFSIAFNPTGNLVVGAGGQDKSIIVWDVATGKEKMRMRHDDFASYAVFSKDGTKILSSGDVTVRVWDSVTGKEITRITHNTTTNLASFNSDGTLVFSYGGDGTLRVWSPTTGKEFARFVDSSPTPIYSASISPDNRYLVYTDGIARVVQWQANDVIESACYHVHRNLTLAEWNQYIGDILPYQPICPNLPLEPGILPTPTVAP